MYMFDHTIFFRMFPMFLILFGIMLACLCLVFVVWMLIDCIKRKEENFKDRTLWIVLLVLGLFFGYSLIISVVYYFAVKQELDRKK